MEEIDINDLDKSKVYCNVCLKSGEMVEYGFHEDLQIYIRRESCKKNKHNYNLRYFEEYGWSMCQGCALDAVPRAEIMKRKRGEGKCSLCKKHVSKRDAFSRGYECGCHDKWFKEHNNSEKISTFREQLGKSNANKSGYCKAKDCKNKDVWHEKLSIVGFCDDCKKKQLQEVHKLNQSEGNCNTCGEFSKSRNNCGVCSRCQSKTMTKTRRDFSELFSKNNSSPRVRYERKQKYEEIYQSIEEKKIDIENIGLYSKVIGSIGLYGICKADGKKYALTAGKSVNLKREISAFLYRIKNPDEQKPYGTLDKHGKIDNDYGRWYDITHDYENFEIVLLYSGDDEIQAYLCEAAWALHNDAVFKKDKNNKKLPNTHGYWMW